MGESLLNKKQKEVEEDKYSKIKKLNEKRNELFKDVFSRNHV
jgi:hypothetical protein